MLGHAFFAPAPLGFFLVTGLGQTLHHSSFRFLGLPEASGHFRHIRRAQGSRFLPCFPQMPGVIVCVHAPHGLARRDTIALAHTQGFQPG